MISKFKVPDMNCNHCVMTVSNALNKVKGVKDVKIQLASKEVQVQHDENVRMQQLADAIEQVGYTAQTEQFMY